MKHMVFFEGLDKTGKTTLHRALASWRRDAFSYFDRGPWTKCMLGRYYGFHAGVAAADRIAAQAASWSIVVYVHRDVDTLTTLQQGDERLSRAQLEEQERLFDATFARIPPAHLVHVHNRPDISIADLVKVVRDQLEEIASRPMSDTSRLA